MSRSSPSACSALPTPEEIKADPDRILELYDCCPKCGGTALEALTWKSQDLDDVTVGCWNPDCGWWITPPGYVRQMSRTNERRHPAEKEES